MPQQVATRAWVRPCGVRNAAKAAAAWLDLGQRNHRETRPSATRAIEDEQTVQCVVAEGGCVYLTTLMVASLPEDPLGLSRSENRGSPSHPIPSPPPRPPTKIKTVSGDRGLRIKKSIGRLSYGAK